MNKNLPLRWRAAVVGEAVSCSGGVCLVVVQVGGQNVTWTVELGAGSLVVTRQDHVWKLGGDGVHPLLPKIPVGLVEDVHVTTLRTTLVGDLASGERNVNVLGWIWRTTWKGGGAAIVAHWPCVWSSQIARKNSGVPVVGVGDVTTVPSEGNTVVYGLAKVLVGTVGVGVSHVVQHSNGELGVGTGGATSPERESLRLSGTVGCCDVVVVLGVSLEAGDLNVVEELAALCDRCDGA